MGMLYVYLMEYEHWRLMLEKRGQLCVRVYSWLRHWSWLNTLLPTLSKHFQTLLGSALQLGPYLLKRHNAIPVGIKLQQ